eukprot:jgi/Bigna1/59535/fgenesh1_kg.5_\
MMSEDHSGISDLSITSQPHSSLFHRLRGVRHFYICCGINTITIEAFVAFLILPLPRSMRKKDINNGSTKTLVQERTVGASFLASQKFLSVLHRLLYT